jgi:hypothetical protein
LLFAALLIDHYFIWDVYEFIKTAHSYF